MPNEGTKEDGPPGPVRANRVDLEDGAGEKTADGTGERSADDVAGEAEAELVLAVCEGRRRKRSQSTFPSRAGVEESRYAQKRDKKNAIPGKTPPSAMPST